MALLHSNWLYITLPSTYFPLLDSVLFYFDSTSLYLTLCYSTMALLHSTWLYHSSTSLYLSLDYSTVALLHCTWLYIILSSLYFTLLDSALFYYGSTSPYYIGVGTRGAPGAHAPPSFQSVPCPLYMSCTTNLHTVPPQSKSLSYISASDGNSSQVSQNLGRKSSSLNLRTVYGDLSFIDWKGCLLRRWGY